MYVGEGTLTSSTPFIRLTSSSDGDYVEFSCLSAASSFPCPTVQTTAVWSNFRRCAYLLVFLIAVQAGRQLITCAQPQTHDSLPRGIKRQKDAEIFPSRAGTFPGLRSETEGRYNELLRIIFCRNVFLLRRMQGRTRVRQKNVSFFLARRLQ